LDCKELYADIYLAFIRRLKFILGVKRVPIKYNHH